jgi:hypothetical protein
MMREHGSQPEETRVQMFECSPVRPQLSDDEEFAARLMNEGAMHGRIAADHTWDEHMHLTVDFDIDEMTGELFVDTLGAPPASPAHLPRLPRPPTTSASPAR